MCEVWNAKILNYRSKPILALCEELRCYIMRKMVGYKTVLSTYFRRITPIQEKKLDKMKV